MNHEPFVELEEIRAAYERIAGAVRRTVTERSAPMETISGSPVYLKHEHTQETGSFKLRGATNAVRGLTEEQKAKGVVGVSTGNHGRGLAFAAHAAGVKCVICMSDLVPQVKIDGIRSHGADVRIIGHSQDEAQQEVDRLVADEGMTMIPPFDHRNVIAGQGTVGLELLEQAPDAGTVLVPVSGGGLISGVAAAVKAVRPSMRVIGVSMERGAAMYACQKAGKPIQVDELPTLADSLGGGIGLENRFTFAMTRDLVDDLVLVSEAEIAAAIRHLYWQERQIVEGSGSVGVAAILAGKVEAAEPVVALLTGGNIAMKQHHRIISGEDVDVSQEGA